MTKSIMKNARKTNVKCMKNEKCMKDCMQCMKDDGKSARKKQKMLII